MALPQVWRSGLKLPPYPRLYLASPWHRVLGVTVQSGLDQCQGCGGATASIWGPQELWAFTSFSFDSSKVGCWKLVEMKYWECGLYFGQEVPSLRRGLE